MLFAWKSSNIKTDLFSVQIDQDGKKAILQLANGDMRRALNILQVCRTGIFCSRLLKSFRVAIWLREQLLKVLCMNVLVIHRKMTLKRSSMFY